MEEQYGVFVTTPPPSETILVARGDTFFEAKAAAMKWADGEITWTTDSEGISAFGEVVRIEQIKLPLRRGKPLAFPKWDEVFETGVFERHLAPELGFHLDKYGEVVQEDRKKWNAVWTEVAAWLFEALRARRIEPYSLQGQEIYPADVKDMIHELRLSRVGPKDWSPRKLWPAALAKALKGLLKEGL
jgi:hypothetical protein